ncbi:MAG: hypothetical protein AAF415_09695 [Pseudomonadota bacterium]
MTWASRLLPAASAGRDDRFVNYALAMGFLGALLAILALAMVVAADPDPMRITIYVLIGAAFLLRLLQKLIAIAILSLIPRQSEPTRNTQETRDG